MSDILKDVNTIWTRLFDHKGSVRGEVQFFLREFEQKNNDLEVEHLFSIFEKITDIRSGQSKRLQESVDLSLAPCHNKLTEALNLCNSIGSLEETFKQNTEVEEHKKKNKLEWEKFVDGIAERCTELDSSYKEKERELRELYSNLQINLESTGTP